MNKKLIFRIDPNSWPPGQAIPSQLASALMAGTCQVPFLGALLNVGRYTRPPTVFGFHLSDLWAWLRYFSAFSPAVLLRLRQEWSSLDSHQKTVASGDFGVGFSTRLLSAILGFQNYVDVLHVVNILNPASFALAGKSRRGPSKSPDFIAYGPGQRISVLECKGSQTSHAAIEASVASGGPQKRNLTPRGFSFFTSLVCGVFVPQWESSEEALVLVVDPEEVDSKGLLAPFSKYEIGRAGMQAALATDLATLSLPATAAYFAQSPVAPKDFGQALDRDLARESISRPSMRDGHLTFQREHRWEVPITIANESITGIRFTGQLSAKLLDEFRITSAADLAESRWIEETPVERPSQATDLAFTLEAATGVSFELNLLG